MNHECDGRRLAVKSGAGKTDGRQVNGRRGCARAVRFADERAESADIGRIDVQAVAGDPVDLAFGQS